MKNDRPHPTTYLDRCLDACEAFPESYREALRGMREIIRRQQTPYPYWSDATLPDKMKVLEQIDAAIGAGAVEAYPLKALLEASNDWRTRRILRPGLFRNILTEGVEQGCLEPQRTVAWEWLGLAAESNDPACFMDDMDRYYDLLYAAAVEGNRIAFEIMNAVWPPEQTVEED